MSEYTYKDVIIDPTSEEARNCVGKEVYFGDDPTSCLSRANNDDKTYCRILQRTELGDYCPFIIIIDSSCTHWGSIIPKKEEPKPEYIPFESVSEFLEAYEDSTYSIACDSVEHKLLSRGGIWLKWEYGDSFDYYNVTEMCDKLGLAIGSDVATTFWDRVLHMYTFLDGTPCGRKVWED